MGNIWDEKGRWAAEAISSGGKRAINWHKAKGPESRPGARVTALCGRTFTTIGGQSTSSMADVMPYPQSNCQACQAKG